LKFNQIYIKELVFMVPNKGVRNSPAQILGWYGTEEIKKEEKLDSYDVGLGKRRLRIYGEACETSTKLIASDWDSVLLSLSCHKSASLEPPVVDALSVI
jgi:hypothetical protein